MNDCLIPCAVLLSALFVQPLTNEDILEPSVRNEVDHALSTAPTNSTSCAMPALKTNGMNRTEIAIRLVSEQKADGRWFRGTNDVTASAIEILRGL